MKIEVSIEEKDLVSVFYWGEKGLFPPIVTWNDLMPVVEKIENTYDEKHGYFGVHIYSNACTIQASKFRSETEDFNQAYLSDVNEDTKLQSTWQACVQFIKWYNNKNL